MSEGFATDSFRPSFSSKEAAVAVFDLDGTLIKGDSFLPFLISYARRSGRYTALATLPLYGGLYVCRLMQDSVAKERLLTAFFAGESLEKIAAHAEWFCKSWVLPRINPVVHAHLQAHLEAGHQVILLSASPDLYVPIIGRFLGISAVICTAVEKVNGLCRGRLAGPNCKGVQKLVALQQYLGMGGSPPSSYAYGDSRSDLPVLYWAKTGFLVKSGLLVPVTRPVAVQ